ncbi:hypothetical protein B0T25DRAFT_549043 [Lasiosphaeria hispida]|uniref:Uncharacterized protein n=1 Tax=Lasiosphaeria hispida TaxID=260671 RepID=A0AAJ0HFE2_9PEZI|nr:hypothetical protein B0T25DRAFT_549043 [Lasiosphaeria hispida]
MSWKGIKHDKRGRPSPVAPLHGVLEPRPLGRSAETGGCRLPKLDEVAKAWKSCPHQKGRHEVDAPTTEELAADLTRPFGQSTGRGFSFTRFRIERGYQTLTMRQQDVLATYIGPNHTATPLTLYEIGHTLTYADPICRHLRWAEEYPFLVPNMAKFGVDPTFSLPINALAYKTAPLQPGQVDMHKRLRCALFHEADCDCLDSVAFAALRCCPHCYTDYTINIVPDVAPGRSKGRLLVFTTWKCLGYGNSDTRCWKTHQKSEPPNRWHGFGHAMWTFEWSDDHCPAMHKINAKEVQHCVASVRERQRVEAPPRYTDVVEPSSRVVDIEKGE